MQYAPGELLHRTKKPTLNFCGFSLLYWHTGLKHDHEETPPSSKLRFFPGMNVQYDEELKMFKACLS
jgi:hypothetical protein